MGRARPGRAARRRSSARRTGRSNARVPLPQPSPDDQADTLFLAGEIALARRDADAAVAAFEGLLDVGPPGARRLRRARAPRAGGDPSQAARRRRGAPAARGRLRSGARRAARAARRAVQEPAADAPIDSSRSPRRSASIRRPTASPRRSSSARPRPGEPARVTELGADRDLHRSGEPGPARGARPRPGRHGQDRRRRGRARARPRSSARSPLPSSTSSSPPSTTGSATASRAGRPPRRRRWPATGGRH